MKRLLLFSILCLSSSVLLGQEQGKEKGKWTEKIDVSRFPHRDSVRRELETIPAFGIYKDNYFVTGTNFRGGGINKNNSDAKFQVSIMHRLIKGILPHEMYVFLTYSQRSFWDIYKKSAPFAETVYNPSLGVGNNIVLNDHVVGVLLFQVEHESNGRDSIWNRSVNKVSFTALYSVNRNLNLQFKVWVPFWTAKENKDINRYAGYWHVAANYQTPNRRFSFSGVYTKRGGWDLNANFMLEACLSPDQKEQPVSLHPVLQRLRGKSVGLQGLQRLRPCGDRHQAPARLQHLLIGRLRSATWTQNLGVFQRHFVPLFPLWANTTSPGSFCLGCLE